MCSCLGWCLLLLPSMYITWAFLCLCFLPISLHPPMAHNFLHACLHNLCLRDAVRVAVGTGVLFRGGTLFANLRLVLQNAGGGALLTRDNCSRNGDSVAPSNAARALDAAYGGRRSSGGSAEWRRCWIWINLYIGIWFRRRNNGTSGTATTARATASAAAALPRYHHAVAPLTHLA